MLPTCPTPVIFPLIEKAVESLQAVNEGLELGMPVDLLQVDLTHLGKSSVKSLGMLLPDELITQLFSQFCFRKIRKIHDPSFGHGFYCLH